MIRNCLVCNLEFKTYKYLLLQGYGKFCSKRCNSISQNKSLKKRCKNCDKEFLVHLFRHKEGRGNYCSQKCYFDKRYGKGERSIKSTHQWIKRKYGKNNKCEQCGTTRGTFDWANKNHLYLRNRSDWMRLCRSCHRKYDIKHNNYHISERFLFS